MIDFPVRDEAERLLEHPFVKATVEQLLRERQEAILEARAATERASLATRRLATDPSPDQEGVWDAGDNRKRKRGLYNLWRRSTLVGTFVDVIAKRFVSGDWMIVPRVRRDGTKLKGSTRDQLLLLDFFSNCNEDEDFKQILYKGVVDHLVFGETYLELVPKAGIPYELYSCNTMGMDFIGDGYGGVKWYTYGTLDATRRLKRIPTESIVRSWMPDISNTQKAFSLLEGMVDPLYSDSMMTKVQQKTFENMGSASETTYNLPPGSTREQAQALGVYLDELYSGVNNAGRERITFGGVNVQVNNRKGLDADFLQGRATAKTEVLGRAHVPPAMVALIESGNIGGGTGESQEKSFRQNVLNFYRSLFLEKLTYQIIVQGFHIAEWVLDVQYADFDTDPYSERVKTVNQKREEAGDPAIPGFDIPIIAFETRSIVPELAPGADGGMPTPGTTGPGGPDGGTQ